VRNYVYCQVAHIIGLVRPRSNGPTTNNDIELCDSTEQYKTIFWLLIELLFESDKKEFSIEEFRVKELATQLNSTQQRTTDAGV